MIPYLCYVVRREGIKPDLKKLQGIMDFRQTATTTEARALTGMVQYYRDMWARWSPVVAPLSQAVSNPKDRKYCGMTL